MVPFAVPHEPATTLVNAWHEVFVPPPEPLQFQYQGPVPTTEVAVPAEQRLTVGATENVLRFEEPQVPFTTAAVVKVASVEYPVPVVFTA